MPLAVRFGLYCLALLIPVPILAAISVAIDADVEIVVLSLAYGVFAFLIAVRCWEKMRENS